ncbi:agamous-like MADS-box protein AGL29 [Humulus lupulus]|uniref:agamous-like MADS-box protein AGL29 n=1 Tax=Humulus lupulus TaxID=3486 RepID=UPI002B40EC6F|nr:agamous-like MADS-box protein AGL29 [Humulus lupulus]
MGRRKIEMEMVKDSSCRQVTFSKRRTGLFKKANELATLCGAEVGILVFSPGGKPFSFGNPNVRYITDRFLRPHLYKQTANFRSNKHCRDDSSFSGVGAAERMNQLHDSRVKQLGDEKLRGEAIDEEIAKGNKGIGIDEMGFEELEKLKEGLEELGEKVKERVVEMEASSTLLMLSNNNKSLMTGCVKKRSARVRAVAKKSY